ncbi:MviN-like protein [Leifsonia sp. 21MFCrub1.1]|nr:MviN-like protein [Leifsonia sp. 21MFCrub1.1]
MAVQGVFRFLYSLIIGRSLGPAALGAASSGISLAQFLALAFPAGAGAAASTFIARSHGAGTPELALSVTRLLSRLTLVTSAVLAVIAGVASAVLFGTGSWTEPVLVAALAFSLATYTYVRGVYFATARISRSLFWDIATTVLGLGSLIAVIVLHWNALLLLPLTFAYALYAIVGWPRSGPAVAPVGRELRNEIVSFIAWSSISALSTGGLLQLSMVIARSVGTAEQSGEYAAAVSLATPASMISSILSLTILPTMAHAVGRRDHDSLRRQTDMAMRGLTAVLGLAFGGLVVLSRPLVEILFGQSFSGAGTILPILMAASFVQSLNVAAVTVLLTWRRSTVRVPSLMSVAGAIVGLVVMALLIPDLSVIGVAIGFLVSSLISGLGPIVVVWKSFRMRWLGLALRLVAGAISVGVLVAVTRAFGQGLLVDVLAALCFVLVWLVLMLPEWLLLRKQLSG